jgi:ABC-type branched-subunit amino acid transport system ATPase component
MRRKERRCARPRTPRCAGLASASAPTVLVSELSHGEQRELELAVALATKPQLLLLDEPMAGLGVTESQRMVALLKELRKEVTIVLVEHDMEAVFALADRITVLGLWPRHRLRQAGRDPQQRGSQTRLSRRPACGDAPWLIPKWLILCLGNRWHRDLLRPEPGAVRPAAHHQVGRDDRPDGPQRHGQDHHHPLHHGPDAGPRGRHPLRRRDVRKLPSYKIAQLGIGLVPEGRQIFPNLTVRENLVAAPAIAWATDPWTLEKSTRCFRGSPSAQQHGRHAVGGEQQMLAIGRALMTNPKLLILDEATEGLAPLIREEIWNCLSMLKGAGNRCWSSTRTSPTSPASPTATTSSSAAARCGAGRASS